jgi:hydroxymethylpyrimidine/phosphomethylpyrimidine kinase
MQKTRTYVISIAGFDPSAGAGILADIKTFEQNDVYGFGVCSAITIQNDADFFELEWMDADKIINQLKPIITKFIIKSVKIGLIKDLDTLYEVILYLKKNNRDVQIVLDPVLKASAGFEFHKSWDTASLEKVLPYITLLTPNYPELKQIESILHNKQLDSVVNILLKGGHSPQHLGVDFLITKESTFEIKSEKNKLLAKHGSGCVLSSAITSNLAKGHSLLESCTRGKRYVESFLESNNSLLGYHSL